MATQEHMKGITGTTEVKLCFIADAGYASSLIDAHTPESRYNFEFEGKRVEGLQLVEVVPYRKGNDGFLVRFSGTDYHGFGYSKGKPLDFTMEAVHEDGDSD